MVSLPGRIIFSFSILLGLVSSLQALSPPFSALPQLFPVLNSTVLPKPNASSSENAALEIHCSGEHFGINPDITDCQAAQRYITPESAQFKWGPRHSGIGPDVIPLPFRTMGGQN